jgi:hypothetical protein
MATTEATTWAWALAGLKGLFAPFFPKPCHPFLLRGLLFLILIFQNSDPVLNHCPSHGSRLHCPVLPGPAPKGGSPRPRLPGAAPLGPAFLGAVLPCPSLLGTVPPVAPRGARAPAQALPLPAPFHPLLSIPNRIQHIERKASTCPHLLFSLYSRKISPVPPSLTSFQAGTLHLGGPLESPRASEEHEHLDTPQPTESGFQGRAPGIDIF